MENLIVIALETHYSQRTVTLLEGLQQGIKFDLIEGLRGKCLFGGGRASYLRVLLSMTLLTRSAVLAFSIDDKDKERIPEVLVSQPSHRRHSGT